MKTAVFIIFILAQSVAVCSNKTIDSTRFEIGISNYIFATINRINYAFGPIIETGQSKVNL
jgi:hypothetical protein